MSLTQAMLTGFTGINSNTVAVDNVGNNLANLNTTAFKSQRTTFETLLYETVDEGDAPSGTAGGTLPRQIGSGSAVAAMQRDYRTGEINPTGFRNDLAIQGDGFFILAPQGGNQAYTRDGSFHFDENQRLVSAGGEALQGFGVDADGAIRTGTLGDLVIPLGSTIPAVATTQVVMDGRLDPGTGIAAAGAVVVSNAAMTNTGSPASETTALTSLVDSTGIALFADGDELVINGGRGGIAVPTSTFVVGRDGTTLGDLAGHLERAIGINPDPATGGVPGITVSDGTNAPAGALVIQSNPGEVNAVELTAASIVNKTGAITSPFVFSTRSPASGSGLTTSFGVFDSLGRLNEVRLRFALESKSNQGNTWRFYAESVDDTDMSPVLGTGTVSFDANGRFLGATGTDLAIDRADTGAATPIAFTLDFSRLAGVAAVTGGSEVVMDSQNGVAAGMLDGYRFDESGVVTGLYSNQREEALGQVALATFANNEGLVAQSENRFVPGPNSGSAAVGAPGSGRAGVVRSEALERSNVEIAREFINLISSSTGISSASRVVRVADDLLQELLLLAR